MSEKNMTEQNKEDSNEENRPLTPSDWVMFLSGEINRWHSIHITVYTFVIAVLALVMAVLAFVILNADNTTVSSITVSSITVSSITVSSITVSSFIVLIFILCAVILCVVVVTMVFLIPRQKIGKFTDIRNDIIYEKLKKYDEIRERCEEAGLFKQKQKK